MLRSQRFIVLALCITFIFGCVLMLRILSYSEQNDFLAMNNNIRLSKAVSSKTNSSRKSNGTEHILSYNTHVFYYPWYGNPASDGKYLHWNHEYIQHWDAKEAKRWPNGRHIPPDDIGSNYYPELGPYSSRQYSVIENHMKQITSAGIGNNRYLNLITHSSQIEMTN